MHIILLIVMYRPSPGFLVEQESREKVLSLVVFAAVCTVLGNGNTSAVGVSPVLRCVRCHRIEETGIYSGRSTTA